MSPVLYKVQVYVYLTLQPHQRIILHTFGCCEGPRSRRYGRTTALRLIVQPCDEDD